MWPLADRPAYLQNKSVVSCMTISEISQFKMNYIAEEEKRGGGAAIFGKDQQPKPVSLNRGIDDGQDNLHSARFELRMPTCLPGKYWSRIPAKRELFRHIPLAHLGLEGQVSETTVLRMHDRRVPITLDMLYKGNATRDGRADRDRAWVEPSEVRHLQEAVLNYAVILNALWPLDYAGFVILRVLVEARWGETGSDNEKQRIQLVRKFFDDVVKDNSGRAVREEPPLDYETAKTRWIRTLESLFPSLSLMSLNPGMLLAKTEKQQQASDKNKRSDKAGGRSAKKKQTTGSKRQGAALNGVPCCYSFNSLAGCKRAIVKANVCKDEAGVHYAHACNHLDSATKKHCLQYHPRPGNH